MKTSILLCIYNCALYIFHTLKNLNTQQVSQYVCHSITVPPSRSNIKNTTFYAARHSISNVSSAISLNVHHNTNESVLIRHAICD
jgi:hypothetical protein